MSLLDGRLGIFSIYDTKFRGQRRRDVKHDELNKIGEGRSSRVRKVMTLAESDTVHTSLNEVGLEFPERSKRIE